MAGISASAIAETHRFLWCGPSSRKSLLTLMVRRRKAPSRTMSWL